MSEQFKRFYDFGPFRLDASERLLMRDGRHVPLTPKAFEMLLVLVENSGRVLTKEELMQRLWPDSFVEEANLSNNIYKLREALGENRNGQKFIETLPRRGYRFVAEVVEAQDANGTHIYLEEQTTARILIEEESETSDAPLTHIVKTEHPAIEMAESQSPSLPYKRVSSRRFKQHLKNPIMLLITGSVLGSAIAFSAYALMYGLPRTVARQSIKITRLTNSGFAGDGAISPDGKFVVYSQNYGDGSCGGCMWVKQVENNNEVQIVPPGKRVYGGKIFSRDGAFIYFILHEPAGTRGAIYKIPMLGGPMTRLIENADSPPSISPDGQSVTFFRNDPEKERRNLIIAALDGSSERALLTCSYQEMVFGLSPAWSPDGNLIAYSADSHPTTGALDTRIGIFVIDIHTGAIRALTDAQWNEVDRIVWTGNGQGIVFVGHHPLVGGQLYYLSYPSGEVRQITSGPEAIGNYGLDISRDASTMVATVWDSQAQLWTISFEDLAHATPLTTGYQDGKFGIAALPDARVVFVSHERDQLDLRAIGEDGKESKPLTTDSYFERYLSATPDGRYLFFISNRNGGSHLFRMDADGSNLKQLTSGNTSEMYLDCSPDNQWVAYSSFDGHHTTLWKIPVEGGTPVQLMPDEAAAPRFSPDGKMIACQLVGHNRTRPENFALIKAETGAPVKYFNLPLDAFSDSNYRWTPDGQSLITSLTEKGVSNLYLQPLVGGEPRRLTDFTSDIIYNFTFSRDGKHIIISRGHLSVDVLLIKDFR